MLNPPGDERMSFMDYLSRRTSVAPTSQPRDPALPLAFLGSIVEASDDAIVGAALDGLVISWNAAATRIFGREAADAIGRPLAEFIPLDVQAAYPDTLRRVQDGERLDHFETSCTGRDGRPLRISLTISPVRDAEGAVFALSLIARDIEVKKHSERASAQLAAIVESSEDAVVSKDLNGVIQSWNAGAERIFGYSAGEIIGKHVTTIIPLELQDEEHTIISRIRAGERIEHFDTIRVCKDGRRIPISLTVSPIFDAHGNVVGASKIARDISERKRAERDARDSRRRLAQEMVALARLGEASARLWECHTLPAGLHEILHTSLKLMGGQKGNIQLVNPARNTLSIVAHENLDADFLATFEHISADDARAACGRALSSGHPVVIEDVQADAAYETFQDVARKAGYRAVVSVPLFAADASKLGAVTVAFESPHRPLEAEMRRLQLYCRQAGDFIQRVRLVHTLRLRE